MCYAKLDKDNQSDILKRIKEYFHFLLNDEEVQKEIKDVFGEFDQNKLYICTY